MEFHHRVIVPTLLDTHFLAAFGLPKNLIIPTKQCNNRVQYQALFLKAFYICTYIIQSQHQKCACFLFTSCLCFLCAEASTTSFSSSSSFPIQSEAFLPTQPRHFRLTKLRLESLGGHCGPSSRVYTTIVRRGAYNNGPRSLARTTRPRYSKEKMGEERSRTQYTLLEIRPTEVQRRHFPFVFK